MQATRVDATGSATLVLTAVPATGTQYSDGSTVVIRNRGTSSVYFGGSDVTTATGFQLDTGESISFDLGVGENVYAVTAGGTETLHVLQGNRTKRKFH